MNRLLFAGACALFFGLVGCGSVRAYRWPLERPAPPSSVPPPVFFDGAMPATSMEELELVEAIGVGTKATADDVVATMQEDARLYGASAIVRVRVDCGHGTCHGYGVAVRYVTTAP